MTISYLTGLLLLVFVLLSIILAMFTNFSKKELLPTEEQELTAYEAVCSLHSLSGANLRKVPAGRACVPQVGGYRRVQHSMKEVRTNYDQSAVRVWWPPGDCEPRRHVALVVALRARTPQLDVFLRHMHAFLRRQKIHYGLYVAEQAGDDPFNKGMLLNAGAAEAMREFPWDCLIFHDPDFLPEDDRTEYGCHPEHARTLLGAVRGYLQIAELSEMEAPPGEDVAAGYHGVTEAAFVGCALALTPGQFCRANGFSLYYWGWDGVDDDMYSRLHAALGLEVDRPPAETARYVHLPEHLHSRHGSGKGRVEVMRRWDRRWQVDGLNSTRYALENRHDNRMARLLIGLHDAPRGGWPKPPIFCAVLGAIFVSLLLFNHARRTGHFFYKLPSLIYKH